MSWHVAIVDEDPLLSDALARRLRQEPDLEVSAVLRADAATPAQGRDADAVIVSVADERSVAEAVEHVRRGDADRAVLVATPAGDVDLAARVLSLVGPLAHVERPFQLPDLLPKLRAALERRELLLQQRALRAELRSARRQAASTAQALRETSTELQTATERLVKAEQLAAVGRVVTGIAHELARQLALVGYAEAIKTRVADDPELVEFADVIVHAHKRLSAMVDEIRDFVAGEQSGPLDREPADVAGVVDDALAIMAYDRDVRDRVVQRKYRAHPLAALHRDKFSQVIINLVSNAVLATEPGDTIEVHVDVDGAAREAIVVVADQGEGMSAEVLTRLGEPFFTTRGDRGSGLGVGICMRIVEEHGGRLTFKSRQGAGTSARIAVPLLDAGGEDLGTERLDGR